MSVSRRVFNSYQKILDSPEQMKKLLSYTRKLLEKCRIGGRTLTAEDVISEVITQLAYGIRSWDRIKEPVLFKFLFPLIKSYVYNFYDKERRTIKPKFYTLNNEAYEDYYTQFVDRLNNYNAVLHYENQNLREVINQCISECRTKEIYWSVLHFLSSGMSPSEIARELRLSLQKINYIIYATKQKVEALSRYYQSGEVPEFLNNRRR